ncbi:MAG TPA: outer membrane protein assembly factor BamD [Pseudobdellovibrionaceae bacterium]|nr:outer membrane protein assembly factor BamD [Pseudobdellovibrionaceae bacterium]
MKFSRELKSLRAASTATSTFSTIIANDALRSARALAFGLSFCLLILSACSSNEKFDTNTPEGLFKLAEEYEKDERYEDAVMKFSEVKNKHPYSRFATEAELRVADVQFKRESYIEAQHAYQTFKELHPKHSRIDYVTFRLGLSYFNQLPPTIDRDLSLADKAILYFDELTASFPKSEFVKEAQEKKLAAIKMLGDKELYIAQFYFKKKQYDSALGRYEGLLRNYPRYEQGALALLGAAQSAHHAGEMEKKQRFLRALYAQHPSSDEAGRARAEFGSEP